MRVGAKIPRGQPAHPSAPREDPHVGGEAWSLKSWQASLYSGCAEGSRDPTLMSPGRGFSQPQLSLETRLHLPPPDPFRQLGEGK